MTRAIFLAALLTPGLAFAFPDGAPWDTLNNPVEACAQCHFDAEPVEDSPALSLSGLEEGAIAGERYLLSLSFAAEDSDVVGFMASMQNSADGAAGAMSSDNDRVKARAAVARSTLKSSRSGDGAAKWSFHWRAPDVSGPLTLRIAANAGNGDASQFGDTMHLKSIDIDVREK